MEHSIFVALKFEYSIFLFHQIKHCLLKRMIPRSLKLVEQFWVYGNFWKHRHQSSLSNFSSFLWHFSQGLWLFWLPYIVAREPIDPIPVVNSSCRLNKIHVFQKMVVESILPNWIKWSWYHSFQKTLFYLMISKYFIFLNINVTKIECSAFLGTPGIHNRLSACYEW